MVNMPFADEAVQLAILNNSFDEVGLHWNLTERESLINKFLSLVLRSRYGANGFITNGLRT